MWFLDPHCIFFISAKKLGYNESETVIGVKKMYRITFISNNWQKFGILKAKVGKTSHIIIEKKNEYGNLNQFTYQIITDKIFINSIITITINVNT